MKYYITGSHGFIGEALCKYLGVDMVDRQDRARMPGNYVEGSTVINLSAYGNHSYQTKVADTLWSNIGFVHLLANEFYKSKAAKLYNISTSSVTLPVQTLYSASKLLGEKIIESYNDPRMVNIRPYSVYGPGEALHRFIPTVIKHLNNGDMMQLDPNAVHDWIYIDDFIRLMFEGETEIGTGVQYTNMQVVRMLEQISGKQLIYQSIPLRSYDTDNWHAPKILQARSLFEGLKQTYEHFTR